MSRINLKIITILFVLSCLLNLIIIKPIRSLENIKCTSQIYNQETNVPLGNTFNNIEVGDELEIQFIVQFDESSKSAQISIPTMEGIDFKEKSSLMIDHTSYDEGEMITLKNQSIISLNVIYTGQSEYIVPKIDIDVIGDKKYSFAFKYQSMVHNEEKKNIMIKAYGLNGDLIYQKETTKGNDVQLPDYKLIGYDFIGFNDKKDGSGHYYQSEKLYNDQQFYAICKPSTYQVYFYADEELIETKEVLFGQKVSLVEAPHIKNKKFMYWYGDIDEAKKRINVYAVYKDTNSSHYFIKGNEEVSIDMEDEIKNFNVQFDKINDYITIDKVNQYSEYYSDIFIDKDGKIFIKELMEEKEDINIKRLALVFSGISVVALMGIRVVKKRREINEE